MKLVFILVDALKSSYLTNENMPFLYKLASKGRYVENVIPSPGFCERSEIFSGLDSFETGNFTAIGFNPNNSPYKNDKILLWFVAILEKISFKYTRYFFSLWRIKKERRMGAYRIPFMLLPNFSLTEDGEIQTIKHREIFDVLMEKGKTFTLDAFTSLSDLGARNNGRPFEFIKNHIESGEDFIPYYIGTIDTIGHRYGSDIESIKPSLFEVDQQIQQIYELISNKGYSLAVLGDHGMVPVRHKIDVMRLLSKTGLKNSKDYIAFYDSTIARFWFKNDKAKHIINSVVKNNLSSYGKVIDKTNYQTYRIPFDLKDHCGNPLYGDLIWCANPGTLISPDYFHSSKESENGMHGYVDVVEGEGTGLFVAIGPCIRHETIHSLQSSSICNELCDILNINYPNQNWKRILK